MYVFKTESSTSAWYYVNHVSRDASTRVSNAIYVHNAEITNANGKRKDPSRTDASVEVASA